MFIRGLPAGGGGIGVSFGANQIAFGNSVGSLTSESAFTYNATTNLLGVDNIYTNSMTLWPSTFGVGNPIMHLKSSTSEAGLWPSIELDLPDTDGGFAFVVGTDGGNNPATAYFRVGVNQINLGNVINTFDSGEVGAAGTMRLAFFQAVTSGVAEGVGKQTVTGSRGANAALTSLLTALAAYGLITNSTS